MTDRPQHPGTPEERAERLAREGCVGLRLHHSDGRATNCPWRFRKWADFLSAFYEAEGEDPSVSGYAVIEADPLHPTWEGR